MNPKWVKIEILSNLKGLFTYALLYHDKSLQKSVLCKSKQYCEKIWKAAWVDRKIFSRISILKTYLIPFPTKWCQKHDVKYYYLFEEVTCIPTYFPAKRTQQQTTFSHALSRWHIGQKFAMWNSGNSITISITHQFQVI